MKSKLYTSSFIALMLLTFLSVVRADTYSGYVATRYYSANRKYFVEVNEKKRATLYLNDRKVSRIWIHPLPELPDDMAISNDGQRVAAIDRYYGNGGDPAAKVVLIFDERGDDLASYSLGEVADLPHVLATTSSAHWYWGAGFTADGQFLIVETFVRKCELPSRVASDADMALFEECAKPKPYERLRFLATTGKMADRSLLATATLDR
jgi:hypothetical protein